MNRPRKKDRHLPPRVHFKHGAYYYVHAGKWERIGATLQDALAEYGRRVEPPKGSMAALIERVYQHHTPTLAESTRSQYRIAADALKKAFAEFSPEQVKGKHVAAFKLAGKAAPNMTNRKLSFLRTVFTYAVEWQLVSDNPCIGVKRHDEDERDRYITDAEYAAIYAKAGPRLRVIMDLLYLTGQRIRDVLVIHRSDLTDEGILFKPRKTKGSTKVKICVEWSPDLRAAVERANALNGNVRAMTLLTGRPRKKGSPVKPPDYRTVKDQWDKACAEAGVDDATPHDLRAKALTDAEKQGIDPQVLAGHASAAMTKRYLRLHSTAVIPGPSFKRAV